MSLFAFIEEGRIILLSLGSSYNVPLLVRIVLKTLVYLIFNSDKHLWDLLSEIILRHVDELSSKTFYARLFCILDVFGFPRRFLLGLSKLLFIIQVHIHFICTFIIKHITD